MPQNDTFHTNSIQRMERLTMKLKTQGLTGGGRWKRNQVDEIPLEVDGSYQPSKGVRPYQIGKIGPPLGPTMPPKEGNYMPRREFVQNGWGPPIGDPISPPTGQGRKQQPRSEYGPSGPRAHRGAVMAGVNDLYNRADIEHEMKKERENPRKYLHQSPNVDYVYRWDERHPHVVLGDPDHQQAGEGFRGSRSRELWNRVLGDDTVYTAGTQEGAELYLIENVLKKNGDSGHEDQKKADDFHAHLYKIYVGPSRLGLRMSDSRGELGSEGYLGIGAAIKNSVEARFQKEFAGFDASDSFNSQTTLQGRRKAEKYLGVPGHRMGERFEFGLSQANKEVIIGPVTPDRIEHVRSVHIPFRESAANHLIKHLDIDVTDKMPFFKMLMERGDSGRKDVRYEDLVREADSIKQHRESRMNEEPLYDTLD
jgi:hypothetical protein